MCCVRKWQPSPMAPGAHKPGAPKIRLWASREQGLDGGSARGRGLLGFSGAPTAPSFCLLPLSSQSDCPDVLGVRASAVPGPGFLS